MAADVRLNIEGGLVAAPAAVEPIRNAVITEPIPRLVRQIAIPAAASNLLMTLFASVDAYWVGTIIGPDGLAAVTTSLFCIWMAMALGEMVGVGLTAVAARRHGERRHLEAAYVVGDALVIAIVLGVALAIAGTLWLDRLFDLMQTPPSVARLARPYLHAFVLATPLIYGYFVIDAAFRAAGDTRTPFVLLSTSVAATLLLDPVLILGRWGAPELGITGASVALVTTRAAAFVFGAVVLWRRGMIRWRSPFVAEARKAAVSISRVGVPTALTGITFSMIYVLLTRTTSRFGTPALAALGIGHRVEGWLYMIAVGFGAAAAAIVGQNLGARLVDRASRSGWLTTAYATIPAFPLVIAGLAIPEWLAALFTNDPAVIAEAASYMRIAAPAQLLLCSEVILEGALGGAGYTVAPMLLSSALTALRIPMAAWAATRWGADGIWWTISITAMARGVAMMILWRSGRWKRTSL
jgi:putative MATE family efflux protein